LVGGAVPLAFPRLRRAVVLAVAEMVTPAVVVILLPLAPQAFPDRVFPVVAVQPTRQVRAAVAVVAGA
jgi:hypothetical protein